MGRHKKRVVRTCLWCGNVFEKPQSVIKHGGGRFCSISCATTYRNTHCNPAWDENVRDKISANHADFSGEKNPMYGRRGESAPSFIDGRNAFSGETYRKILLASGAEYKCAICGATERLHVHHCDGNHENNDVNNLVWLCCGCHNNIAHKYTRDTFGRFVGSKINETMFERGDAICPHTKSI